MTINIPDEFLIKNAFTATINTRVLDVNASGHVGNSVIMEYVTESISILLSTEDHDLHNIANKTLIFKDISLSFKKEIMHPNKLTLDISVVSISRTMLVFHISLNNSSNEICCICLLECVFINDCRKLVRVPEQMKLLLDKLT